ncbi:amidase family protein [Reticulomyxa filosa]|uniref:Amidase family protein n=1 Tax=Reticulomyxa filosa TaxID=46433 RepID=X6LGT9_RETFI|nr:amidase family protein [Reticulomyxa filosa]|eukprot:ETO00327.1 amidase family protein [Reticulomyxa filosa]
MQEIGIVASSVNPNFGNIFNPYGKDLHREAGPFPFSFFFFFFGDLQMLKVLFSGSSSASGAAVAAGLLPVALGADGGGSIRIPSSLNGVVGLSATFGRVPHVDYGCWSHVHKGALTTTLRDQMLTYYAISGAMDDNVVSQTSKSATNPPKHFHGFQNANALSDVTVGIWWDWFADADPQQKKKIKTTQQQQQQQQRHCGVVKQCDDVVRTLKEHYNVKIKNYTIDHLKEIVKSHQYGILTEFAAGLITAYLNKYKCKYT